MVNMPKPDDRAGLSAAGTAAGLGCSIVITIILCIGGGLLLDRWLGWTPVLTLTGVALGLLAAAYQLYELATIGRKDRDPGPLAKTISKAPLGRRDKH